jgi:MFS family permease
MSIMTNQEAVSRTPPARETPLPGARVALILLLAINLFNYIDRQVLAAVEPDIRRELLPPDDPSPKFKMGLLSTAFLLSYMVTAPLFGWLADRTSRWKLIGIGVLLWTLASGASGINWHEDLGAAFTILLLTRCFVGVGEGGYGPVAPTLISDLYPVKVRGRVLAYFYLAIPVGGALGYALGGQMAASVGWRWAFYSVVPPGLLLALFCFFMREPPRGQADAVDAAATRKARASDYLDMLRIPSWVLNTLGMAAMTFAIGALAYWMPDYLEHRAVSDVNIFGVSVNARTFFGALTALAGLVATLLGGIAGDRLRDRIPGSYFLVSGLAMLVGCPMVLLVLWTPFPWAWFFVFGAVFCIFFNTGPTNTILANVTHPAVRATGFALNILVIHLFGDAISPPIIGLVADWTSMDVGFAVVSGTVLLGGVIWLFGTSYLERDTALAPQRLKT